MITIVVFRSLELVLASQLLLAIGEDWWLAAISKAVISIMTLTALILIINCDSSQRCIQMKMI